MTADQPPTDGDRDPASGQDQGRDRDRDPDPDSDPSVPTASGTTAGDETDDHETTPEAPIPLALPDGRYTAVLDRREGEQAVLLVERADERPTQLVVDADVLPAGGRTADAVHAVTVSDGAVRRFEHRPAETERRAESAQSRFDRLTEQTGSETDEADGDEDE